MIKSLLYSIFLHSLLLLTVYYSFNLKSFNENNSSQIAISLVSVVGDDNSKEVISEKPITENNEITEKKSEEKEEPKKEKEVEKKEEKPEVKKEPKKKPEPKKQKKQKKKSPKKAKKSEPKKTSSTKNPKQEKQTKEFKKDDKEKIVEKAPEVEKKEEEKKEEIKEDKKIEEPIKKEEITETTTEKKDETAEPNSLQPPEAVDVPENIPNIDLSAREKFNLQTQLKSCYKQAIERTKLSSNVRVIVKVNIDQEGYITSNLDKLINMEHYNNPKDSRYKVAVDNVKLAIDICSPLRNLPLEKYEVWHEAVLEFNGDDVK